MAKYLATRCRHHESRFTSPIGTSLPIRYGRYPVANGGKAEVARTSATIERSDVLLGPTPGQHTEAVLAELGYDGGAIAKLRAANVI
jgi:hypothetical protein